jgi:hypothetical protein
VDPLVTAVTGDGDVPPTIDAYLAAPPRQTADEPAMTDCADWCCLKGCVLSAPGACRCDPSGAWCTCGARPVATMAAEVTRWRMLAEEAQARVDGLDVTVYVTVCGVDQPGDRDSAEAEIADLRADLAAQRACCAHPLSEHGDDGCLNGWDDDSRLGCACKRRGMADRG